MAGHGCMGQSNSVTALCSTGLGTEATPVLHCAFHACDGFPAWSMRLHWAPSSFMERFKATGEGANACVQKDINVWKPACIHINASVIQLLRGQSQSLFLWCVGKDMCDSETHKTKPHSHLNIEISFCAAQGALRWLCFTSLKPRPNGYSRHECAQICCTYLQNCTSYAILGQCRF